MSNIRLERFTKGLVEKKENGNYFDMLIYYIECFDESFL